MYVEVNIFLAHPMRPILLKMSPMFWSKIIEESWDSRSYATETTQKWIVPAMVDKRNNFSNKFDDFQTIIEGLKNRSFMVIQRFERLEA